MHQSYQPQTAALVGTVVKSTTSKEIDKLIGKEVFAAIFPPFMTRVVVMGKTLDENKVILSESEHKFTVYMGVDEFLSKSSVTALSNSLTHSKIMDITKDPDNKLVIVRTIWDETDVDKQYQQYCASMGRNMGYVEIKQPDNPEMEFVPGELDPDGL